MERLLIIGLGSIGERHLRCALRTGRAELSVCEINDNLLNTVAERYGISKKYTTLDEAIAAQPTCAVVCVPAQLHIPMTTRLVSAGIHVLIEKPLSTSLAGVDDLVKLVDQQQVVAAVGYVNRANPTLTAAREAIQSGRFGKPLQLVCVSGQNFPHYRPAYRDTYFRDRATGGGAVQDALTHMIDAAQWLIGPADRVIADAAHQSLPGVDVEDTVHVMARHQGTLAAYTLNQYQAPNEVTITVVCERGTVRFELHTNRWQWMSEPGSPWNDHPGESFERDDLFVSQLHHFFDAIEHRARPLCTLADGIQSLQTNLAILESLDDSRWIATGASENYRWQ